MAQKDGKYLIVKDPNKAMIRFGLLRSMLNSVLLGVHHKICFSNNNDLGDSRLYDIPDSTFESEEDTDESEEGRLINS